MRVIIIGAGPAGLTLGATLAARHHDVVAIDRDPGPAADGSWRRIGVAQFEHAHGFRVQVPELLQAEWPHAYDTWMGLGAEPILMGPPGEQCCAGIRSRRVAYERALRDAAARTSGLTVATGNVTALVQHGATVVGVAVDGRRMAADLVVDASGRGTSTFAGPVELDAECGISYIGRTYRRHRGTVIGPMTSPSAWGGTFDGYHAIVIPHEGRHLSAVLVRPTADATLRHLRHAPAFDTAAAAIPGMREWTARDRAVPTSGVVLGGRPRNTYRRQRHLRGLVAVGDTVSTTTPTAGRGIAMASLQIGALLGLLDAGHDPHSISRPFEAWCDEHIRPWVVEHIARDDESVQRMSGADIDLSRPLTTAAIVDAALVDARISPYLAEYLSMRALPSSLAAAERFARAAYESGWRAPVMDGPTRDELVRTIQPQLVSLAG